MYPSLSGLAMLLMSLPWLVGCAGTAADIDDDLLAYVDPFIGSVAKTKYYGRTFPGATRPFSLVQLSPDTYTGGDLGSGYSYEHTALEGFSFVHMSGIGWFGEFGNLLVTPTNGDFFPNRGAVEAPYTGYRSSFSHETEVAEAGYYAVTLDDYGVRAEMTTTPRSGILRFTFPQDSTNRIQMDLARRIGGTSLRQYIRIIDDRRLEGWMYCAPEGGGWGNGKAKDLRYTAHFYGEFSRPFIQSGIWSAPIPADQVRKVHEVVSEDYQAHVAKSHVRTDVREYEGDHLGFYATFPDLQEGEEVLFKAGISFVDMEGAKNNLRAELDHWDFDSVRREAQQAWREVLDRITIEGATAAQKKIFYTGMYHAHIDPRRFTDVDGRYYGGDYQIHAQKDFDYRTIFSGWDAFRSHVPLMSIIDPFTVEELVRSLIDKGTLGGRGFPKWEIAGCYSNCMLGDPAIPVILDALTKGIDKFDLPQAYALAKQTSLGPITTRNGWEAFNTMGFVTCDPVPERWRGYYKGVSATLENAYADWSLSRLSAHLGQSDEEQLFLERSNNYKKIYDPSVGFMRGRYADGSWIPWEGPLGFQQGCIESNPLQQTWFVPHDIEGLRDLLGADRFLSELEQLFEKTPEDFAYNAYYNHANEPVHHIPYLFNFTEKPWLTQKWVRTILNRAYGTSPYGIMGNEDVGQMSAWYILSAMGFHPVCPGNGRYELGSPLFDQVTIRLDPAYYPGGAFVVKAINNSAENIYVQSVSLNGQPLDRTYIFHDEIAQGGELVFEMGPAPNVQSPNSLN